MARNFSMGQIPKNIPAWQYNAFRNLVDQTEQQSSSVAAIVRGESPDGSGAPLVDTSMYFNKRGLLGGQIAYGGTAEGNNLTLGSTTNTSKGYIYFGSASAYNEGKTYLGLNTTSPTALLHLRALSDASSTLLPSSDIAVNWNPKTTSPPYTAPAYYTNLAGAQQDGSHFSALATNNGTASFIAINVGQSVGVNPEKTGLSGVVEDGRIYLVTCSVFTLSGTLPAGSDLYMSLVTNTGIRYRSQAYSLTGIGTTPTTITVVVSTAATSNGTGTPNSFELEASGGNSYVCVSYVAVTPSASDIVGWYTNAGAQKGRIASNGHVGIQTGSDSLDASMLRIGNSSDTTLARITLQSSSTSASPLGTPNLIEAKNADAIPKTLFSVANNGAFVFGDFTNTGNYVLNEHRLGQSRTVDVFQYIKGLNDGTSSVIFRMQSNGTLLVGSSQNSANNRNFVKFVVQNDGVNDGSAMSQWLSNTTGSTTLEINRRAVVATGRIKVDDSGASSTGVRFTDDNATAANAKLLAFDVKNITAGTTRTMRILPYNGNLPVVGDFSGTTAGSMGVVSSIDQGAAIAKTALTSSAVSGMYSVSVYYVCTTADTPTAPTVQSKVYWTDATGTEKSITGTGLVLDTVGNYVQDTITFHRNSGELHYEVTTSGTFTNAKYAIYLRLTYLG